MPQIPKIERERLEALNNEVDALDRLQPSLETRERVVKLIADKFSVPVATSYRVSGGITYFEL